MQIVQAGAPPGAASIAAVPDTLDFAAGSLRTFDIPDKEPGAGLVLAFSVLPSLLPPELSFS